MAEIVRVAFPAGTYGADDARVKITAADSRENAVYNRGHFDAVKSLLELLERDE